MNLFVTSRDPIASALWLNDVRALQMVRETGQILSSAIIQWEGEGNQPEGLYKAFNHKHPVNIWTSANRDRMWWVLCHGEALARRTEKHERAKEVLAVTREWLTSEPANVPRGDIFPFQNSAGNKEKGLDFKSIESPFVAYRKYLNTLWDGVDAKEPTWKTGIMPYWYWKAPKEEKMGFSNVVDELGAVHNFKE